jgi:hypothetical protein
METLLHTSSEHLSLWWIAVPSLLSLLAGIGIELYDERVREWLGRTSSVLKR